jgi:predicted permease
MLRPLPLPEPHRLFTLSTPAIARAGSVQSAEDDGFSYPDYVQFRDAATGMARVAVVGPAERREAQSPDRTSPLDKVVQQFVSGEMFDILAVRPSLGQLFSGADDRGTGTARVAVVSFDYWHRRFNADPTVINQSILLNGSRYRIIGVTAEGFFGVEPGTFVDVWLPVMTFDPGVFTNPAARLFRIIGRLSGEASHQQLQARLQPVFHHAQQSFIALNPAMPTTIVTQLEGMEIRVNQGAIGLSGFRRAFGRPLGIIAMVAAAILLIAVANVASLLMGRSTARSGEMALRLSLGAGRARLVRQLLTESVVLSVLAGVLGWLMASAAAPSLVALLSKSSDPFHLVLSMNTRALWFCAGVCGVCAISFGLMPAWTATSAPVPALREAPGDRSTLRISRVFVGVQMAFAFCLVVAAAGFLFSLHKLFTVDIGFDANQVTVLTLRSDLGPHQDGLRLTQALQRHVAMRPNVQSAAVGWWAIFDGSQRRDAIVLPGKAPSTRQEIFYRVSPGYFATLRTPLLDGRDLHVLDTDGQQPIPTVVNRSFERTYFGDSGALGAEFQRADGARHLIVGIAADSYYEDLRRGPQPIAYFPMKPPRFFTLYVRSALDPGSVMRLVEQEATAMAPGIHVFDVTTLKTLVGNSVVTERLLANLGSVFATIGLILAAIGVFGVLNYTVLRRTKEIGIRAALGAGRGALVVLVVKDFVGIVAIALATGLAGSIGIMSLVRAQLFGIRPAEPLVVVAALVVFVIATAIAVMLPVLRAASVDPMIAVRND